MTPTTITVCAVRAQPALLVGMLTLCGIATAAQPAARPAASAPAAATLPAVPVRAAADEETATSPVFGYRARRSATATKTDTPLAETPQSVTVVTREQIVDQGARTLQDALTYAAGVRSDAYGLDSRTDSTRVRGSDPVSYLDGLRTHFDYYTSSTRTEPYTLERIEVLRGPAAMLYGQGSTGGVLNMVSKRPQADAAREIGVEFGSFGRRQLQTDLTGPLTDDGRWLYRLVAVGRDADTQVDHVRDDRALLAPLLTWRPSAATTLTLQALWQRDKSGSTSQFLPWDGVLLPNPNGAIPTHRFIGEPDLDRYDSERQSVGWLLQHEIDERWTLRHHLRWTHNEVSYHTLYADSFSNPASPYIDPARRVLNRYPWAQDSKVRMLTLDQHVEGRLGSGALQHQVLAGVDVAHYRLERREFADGPTAPIDVYAPVYGGYAFGPLTDRPRTTQRQIGLYLQDQMRLGERWILVAGLRHDRVRSGVAGQADENARATTKRFGLMYAAANGISPYLSYSESFTPVGGTDLAGNRFEPLRGTQWEAGVKVAPVGLPLSLSLAAYDLKERNRLVPDPANPVNNSIQTGETRTTGAEVELKATLARHVDMVANYTYTDIDEALEALPKHQASVWGKWRLASLGVPGVSVGAGLRWLDSFRDGAAPQTPSVALLDAMVSWDTPHWRYALNITNLTDKVYVATCLGRGDCWWGARRNVVASATYRF